MSPRKTRTIGRILLVAHVAVELFLWITMVFFLFATLSMFITNRETGIPSVLGHSVVRVETGSMIDAGFAVKSYTVIRKCDTNKLKKGDYIAFYYYSTPGASYPGEAIEGKEPKDVSELRGRTIVFHEIISFVEKDGHRWFVTKGSNNPRADSIWIYDEYVVGQYRNIGTLGSDLLNYFMSPRGRILLVTVPAALIVALNTYQIFLIISKMREVKREGQTV